MVFGEVGDLGHLVVGEVQCDHAPEWVRVTWPFVNVVMGQINVGQSQVSAKQLYRDASQMVLLKVERFKILQSEQKVCIQIGQIVRNEPQRLHILHTLEQPWFEAAQFGSRRSQPAGAPRCR